jgi:hypothetical protein
MVAENLDARLKCARVHEGGHSNDRDDPGGDHPPLAAKLAECQLEWWFVSPRDVAHVNHHVLRNALCRFGVGYCA